MADEAFYREKQVQGRNRKKKFQSFYLKKKV